MAAILAWFMANSGWVFSILFFISEGLAFIPGIKGNGVFQVIFNWLKGESGN